MSYVNQYDNYQNCVIRGKKRGPALFGGSSEAQLNIRIRPPPHERNPHHPIFPTERAPRPAVFLHWQNPRGRSKRSSRHRPTHRARRHPHLGIVPNPLGLPHIAARHHVKLARVLAKPNRRGNPHSSLAKRGQRNIFLTLKRRGNLARHGSILEERSRKVFVQVPFRHHPLSSLVRTTLRRLPQSLHMCYKPEHA